jgi:hypothetical protein
MSFTAAEHLNRAEEIDGYRGACGASFSNATARKLCSYRASMVSSVEADRLLAEVDKIDLLNSATIIVMDPSAENGYPHTRAPNLVCMPTTSIEGKSTEDLATTLRHEAIHLHQRANPERWIALCKKEGWVPLATTGPSMIPHNLLNRCRLNPDTFYEAAGQFWAWKGQYVPLPLFSTEYPSNLGDVVIKWYDLETGRLISSPPSSFQARYGVVVSQPEHPFEILAVEAAEKGIATEKGLIANLFKD